VKIKIQVVVESDNGEQQVIQEVAEIERSSLQPENLGLSLTEAKTLLQQVQHTLVKKQVAEYEQQNNSCQHCSQKLLQKDKRTILDRTLFGKLKLRSSRLFHCNCQKQVSWR
jgi:DNA-directed RNA polymerase subunit RPC12/RpoP